MGFLFFNWACQLLFSFFLLDNTCWQQLELVLNRLLIFLLRGRHYLLN